MELFYVPDIEKEYKPKGWVPSTMDKLLFAHAEGWQKHTETLEELGSLFHRYAQSCIRKGRADQS